MRHNKIVSDTKSAEPADVGEAMRPEAAADRTTGISKAQAATAAAKNVMMGDVSPARITAMAVNFVEALHDSKPNRLSRRIASITARTSREYFESESYRPHRSIRRDIAHQPYIDHLLSPSDNLDIRWDLSTTLLANLADTHHCDLDQLRARSRKAIDKAYDWIIRGDLSVALEAARDEKLPAHDRGDIARVVRNHARCFAVATAHTKIGLLRTHSTSPGGNRFSGFKTWCLLGHTAMATIAAPASIIQQLASAGAAGTFDGLDDDETHATLVQLNLLPPGMEGQEVFDLAQTVRRTLKTRRCGRGGYDFKGMLNFVARQTAPAAALNRGEVRRAGWTLTTFAEYRIGLTASEGAAFVALELLRSFRDIDSCVEAVLAGKPLPPTAARPAANKAVAFVSVLLRAEGRPDKNAPLVGDHASSLGTDIDKSRGCGRIASRSMFSRIQDPLIERQARKILGVDATVWFK